MVLPIIPSTSLVYNIERLAIRKCKVIIINHVALKQGAERWRHLGGGILRFFVRNQNSDPSCSIKQKPKSQINEKEYPEREGAEDEIYKNKLFDLAVQ